MTQTIYGRILTPDGLRFICASFDYDPERIGKHKISTSSTTNDLRKAFNLGLIKRHPSLEKTGRLFPKGGRHRFGSLLHFLCPAGSDLIRHSPDIPCPGQEYRTAKKERRTVPEIH